MTMEGKEILDRNYTEWQYKSKTFSYTEVCGQYAGVCGCV